MLKAPEVLSLNEHPPPSINSATVVTKQAVHPRARFFYTEPKNRTRANHVPSLSFLTSSDEQKKTELKNFCSKKKQLYFSLSKQLK
jgi:hypothetical protein